jgi:sortase (surface protein transpeptidase)
MLIRNQKRKRRVFLSWFLISITLILLTVALYFSWGQEKNIIIHYPQGIIDTDGAMPTTKKPQPNEFDNYTVAADMPRYLFIEKLGIKAMIKPMSVDVSNRIEAPQSAFDVGWYDRSAKPGQDGALLLDGHVSAGRTPGVFYDLKNLAPNDSITLERGDGVTLMYRVIKSQVYDINNVDMAAVLAPITASQPGLNLITCTGNAIEGTNNYNQRLVVFAEQQ